MSTSEALRTWIESELPHLQPPSEETLNALLENSTTSELWDFLITRARSTRNANAARAALKLSGEHYTRRDEGYDQELVVLNKEARELESEIEELRNGLEGDEEQLGGLDDVVLAAFQHRERDMRDLIEELNYVGDEDGNLEGLLCSTEITAESLQAIETAASRLSPDALLSALQTRLEDAEGRVLPADVPRGSVAQAMERMAADAALVSHKEMCRVRDEHEAAAKRLEGMVESVGKEGHIRVLAAQLEGERAVLEFAKERVAVQRIPRVGEVDVEVVEEACERICKGNLDCLAEVRDVFEAGRGYWDGVREGVRKAVQAGVAMTEPRGGGDDGDGGGGGGGRVCECAEREAEVTRLDKMLQEIDRRLGERCSVTAEARDSASARADCLSVEKAIREAELSREVDAVRVRDELMAFVKQPGKAVAAELDVR